MRRAVTWRQKICAELAPWPRHPIATYAFAGDLVGVHAAVGRWLGNGYTTAGRSWNPVTTKRRETALHVAKYLAAVLDAVLTERPRGINYPLTICGGALITVCVFPALQWRRRRWQIDRNAPRIAWEYPQADTRN